MTAKAEALIPGRALLECDAAQFQQAVERARDSIIGHRLYQPQVGIILGSGLSPLAERVAHASSVDYEQIPYFPRTHACGHTGRLVFGFLSGMPVVLMQGRAHRYEGLSNVDVSFPVHCLHALGVRTLIATNAAGGLNTRFRTGDLMVIDEHLDFLWLRGLVGRTSQPAIRGTSPYDNVLIERVRHIARAHGIVLHQGCYLGTLGPTYETRSEYRMFRGMGADAVGMSTIPEVLAASQLKMRTLAMSVITNVASTDVPMATTHSEVLDSGSAAGPKLLKIIHSLLEDMSGQPD